jgi:hypothetical protein
MIANGAKVNSNKSLLLFEEIKKITIPIKNEAIIFLKETCKICGLLDNVANIETIKNNAMVA